MAKLSPPNMGMPIQSTTYQNNGITQYWFNWFNILYGLVKPLNQGFSGTVPLGKLTTGGTAGSLVYLNGILQSVVDPT